MRKNAMRQNIRKPEGVDNVFQRNFDRMNTFRFTADRVGPDHHITNAISKAVEDLPSNVVNIVGRGIGLDPRTEIPPFTDI